VSVAGTANGGALDLKIDLCGHCIFQSAADAKQVIVRLAQQFELAPSTYAADVADLGGHDMELPEGMVAFIGVGAEPTGKARINVYVNPQPPPQCDASRS
jgi:hypothetical protein